MKLKETFNKWGQNLKTNFNTDNKKKTTIVIASIVLVLVLVIGTTFALSIFEKASDANLVKTGSISMHYTESSNVINITNALPMSDRDGEIQTNYFDFSITSDAKTNADDSVGITIPYDLIIEPKAIDTDKDALSPKQIKIFLTKIENGVEETVIASTLLSNLELKETNYNLYSTENIHKNGSSAITTKYRLRAWIDYNVEAKDWNKSAKPKQYKFAINVNGTQKVIMPEPERPTNAADFEKLVGFDGLVKEEHPETEQLQATTDYRYTGKNPDNYVRFNDELWRIIGIFETDDGTGNLEKRIKLIRNESIGDVYWSKGVLATNDWSQADGMTLLNSGDYWNRTGSYSSTGLTKTSKQMIDNAKWYLGGTNLNSDYVNGEIPNAQGLYNNERGTDISSNNSDLWVGKVAIMYSSDYAYATSGDTTNNRATCLEKKQKEWGNSSLENCKNNNWLYLKRTEWTLDVSSDDYGILKIDEEGYVTGDHTDIPYAFRPTVYLKSDTTITGGTGTESDPYTFLESELLTGTEELVAKEGTGGLVAESHPATSQTLATTAYRYTGSNPDNYVSFNNELWRIIGVFDVDDGTGNIEQRIKLIRKDSLGDIAWDNKQKNNWSNSSSMSLLNTGNYWNRTGNYSTTGLTTEAKNMIDNAKWYLGGFQSPDKQTKYFYENERGTMVSGDNPINWIGKVGLMYTSDFGYATGGGSSMTRTQCLSLILSGWTSSSISNCTNNNWLHYSPESLYEWTISHNSGHNNYVYTVSRDGTSSYDNGYNARALRPTVYLSSDIQITGGSGTESNPYTLSK